MPLALLLSPDDQAVSAITGVLEEMSVTCERPLDGVSAAQLLNSHTFDLVLVDCENLPAAKLIFDVCRRGKNGNNPVPIAIVDGRAGLPTAFRLGAELILTKPVAKDQARTTIRTAVGRVRKDVPAVANASAQAAAAAAAAVSSQAAVFADPASNVVAHSAVSDEVNFPAPIMNSVVDAQEDLQKDEIAAPIHSKPLVPIVPSDDPVLAELERTELEASERAQSQTAKTQEPEPKADSQNESLERLKAYKDNAESKSDVAVVAPRARQQKTHGPLVALMVLAIAVGGLYGAWMYEPGFRAIAQPQIDQVLALAGMAKPAAHAPASAKSQAQPTPSITPAPTPAPAVTPDSGAAQPASSNLTTDSASAPPSVSTAPPAAAVPASPSSSSGAATAPSASASAATPAPAVSNPSDAKKDAAKNIAAPTSNASPSSAPLPGEKTAIILSSQGAQKRLLTSVPPKYPAEARSEGGEGTVVLKAVIDETGKVDGLRLVEGNATLASAAMKSVKQWRYRPYVRDGKTQPFQTIIIVDFQRQ